jgi:hypothetical protein
VRHATVSAVAQLQPQLADVEAELGVLRGEVSKLHASKQETIVMAPVNWPALSAKDAEAVWEALGRWVQEVLGGWCEVTRDQLPDCWALHRPALMQVSWLWTSHTEAYLPSSRAHQAAEWHTRWLDAALEKIKTVIPVSQCRPVAGQPGQHLVHRLDTHEGNYRQHVPAALASDAVWAVDSPRSGAGALAAGSTSGLGQQVIYAPFWRPYFRRAMQVDLAERRRREAQAADLP